MQAEWQARPVAERGLMAEVLPHTDAMSDAPPDSTKRQLSHASTRTRQSGLSMDPTSLANALSTAPALALALANLHNGACGALYAPLQLHLERRKRTQLLLLRHEEAALRSSFNSKFDAARKQNRECLDKVAERAARIADIQRNLGCAAVPRTLRVDAREDVDAQLAVADGEIDAAKWLCATERCVPSLGNPSQSSMTFASCARY
jgi:hypothetical protein